MGRHRPKDLTGSVSFDRAAGYYDQTRAAPDGVMAQLVPLLVQQLPAGEVCLEIGIGTGRIALPLVGAGVRVVGVDISTGMLRKLIAKRATAWPLVAVADATRLPLAEACFGSAIASHVLHLIPEWRMAVAEVARVVRPGGVFLPLAAARTARSGWKTSSDISSMHAKIRPGHRAPPRSTWSTTTCGGLASPLARCQASVSKRRSAWST